VSTNLIPLIGVLVTNLVTNWTDAKYNTTTLLWPPEANRTTHYENGTVEEVVSLQIEYDGRKHIQEVSRRMLFVGQRTYWMETVRRTGPESWKPATGLMVGAGVTWTITDNTNVAIRINEINSQTNYIGVITNADNTISIGVITNK